LTPRRLGNCKIAKELRATLYRGTLVATREERTSYLSKDDLIDMQGTVVAVHSGGLYRVQCDAGHEVLAQLSGRMRRFRIKVVPGDRVTVGVSPYDPVRGIITFRAR
jgi:translation initiation factor IF-1